MKIIQTEKPKGYKTFHLFGKQPDKLYFEVPEMVHYNNLGAQVSNAKGISGMLYADQVGERVFVVAYDKRKVSDEEIIKFATNIEIKDI